MRALITGGAGFIGSHLADALVQRNWKVSVIDDLSTGSMDNIDHLRENPHFDYTIDNILNRRLMAEMVDRADVVYHLAAAVGVRLIFEKPIHTIETNILGSQVVLEMAAKKHKRVLMASSSEVYGKSQNVPFSETEDMVMGPTTCPRWSYACSKQIEEFLSLAYAKEFQLPVVIARFFNTVGPRQVGHYGMVIPRFVENALLGKPLEVHGDGEQTRCFIDVQDTVRAIMALVEKPEAMGHVFNIGSDREITINDLAQLVKSRVNSHSDIVHIPYEQAYGPNFEDLGRRVPNIKKIKDSIGFQQELSIEQTIDRIIEFYRKRL